MNLKSLKSVAESYLAMLSGKTTASASKPKWVPASITEENVTSFVQAVTEARKAGASVVEFNGKKYGIKSIKEDANKEDENKSKKIQDMDAENAPKQASDDVPAEVKEEDSEEIKGAHVADKAADADDMEKVDSAEDMVKEEDAEEIQADSNSEADDKADKRGEMAEELSGNQKKLDVNHNGKIDGDDLKKLRGMKNESTESTEVDDSDKYYDEEMYEALTATGKGDSYEHPAWKGHKPIRWHQNDNSGEKFLARDVKSKLHGVIYPQGTSHDDWRADHPTDPRKHAAAQARVKKELGGSKHIATPNPMGFNDKHLVQHSYHESTESLDESMDKMSKPDLWVAHANHKMDSDPEISMDRKNVHHHAKAAAAIEKHVAAKFGDQHATAMKSHTDLIHGVKTQMNSPESDKEDLRDARKLRKQHGASHDAFNHLGESADADSDDKPADHAEPDADNMGGPSDHDADNEGEDEKKENEKPKMTGEQVLRSVADAYSAMNEESDAADHVSFDIPLLVRLLESVREDVKSDEDLHIVVEKIIAIKNRGVLTMADYDDICDCKKEESVKEETENDEDDEDEKDSEKGPDSAEAGPEVMDPATQKMKDAHNKNVEIKDGVPGSAQDGADDLNPADKPAPANKSASLPNVPVIDAPTKLGESTESVEVNEGAYVGGPKHTQAQWTGGINSKKSNEIRKHLIDKGHSFNDHSHIAANKQSNTHYISMNSKEGHEELQKIKKKHGLGHYPYGTPGHLSAQDHKGKAEKEDLPTHVKHDHSASYM